MDDELKPCPFCGGTHIGWTWHETYSVDSSYATFGCDDCGAGFLADDNNTLHPDDVAAWNRRTPDLIPRADAELAVAEAIRRAADMIEDNVRHAKELGREIWAMPDLRALAPAEALAEVQRLREERDQAVRGRNEWRDDFKALAAAVVGDTGLSAMTVAAQARTFRPRAERAEAERDAALARVEKLREAVSDFATAKIDELRYSPPYGSSPEDEPDPVVDAETVWALQIDARAALAEDARHG